MWYWFCLIASVTLVIGAVAAILWWAWRQETASRFADTLDRRFAKEKPKVKWWRTKDWPESTLEQRVTALEKRTKRQANLIERLFLDKWEAATPSTDSSPGPTLEQRVTALERQIEMDGRVERHEAALYNVAIRLEKLEAATPSPPTASPTTDSPSDAVQETTGVWTPQSWQLDPRITPGGPVGFGSEFVDPEDAWT